MAVKLFLELGELMRTRGVKLFANLERWLLRFLVRRQVARGFNDWREMTAMWRMVSEEAYKITPGHGTSVLLGQTLNRAQRERKAHELRRQLSEIEKTQRKNMA